MEAIQKAILKYNELCSKAKGKMLKSVALDYIDVTYRYYELPISNNAKKMWSSANSSVLKIKRFQDTVTVERFYAKIDGSWPDFELYRYRQDYRNRFK